MVSKLVVCLNDEPAEDDEAGGADLHNLHYPLDYLAGTF